MSKFIKEIDKYVKQNSDSIVPKPFEFEETTVIDPELAFEIYTYVVQATTFQELYEKECDYSRLLRNENQSLRAELDKMCNDNDENLLEEESKFAS